MKVLLNGKDTGDIKTLVEEAGFEVVSPDSIGVEQNPDLVISHGGDGTLLSSERKYPGIPKLPIRNSAVCKKCSKHQEKVVLENLKKGKLKLQEFKKLTTSVLFKDIFSFNDFVVRNASPIHSIRFRISINNQLFKEGKLWIGDGIVVSTPWGSTGYFKSVTSKSFTKGIGLAFNNTTEKMEPLILKETDLITIHIIRGKATLSWDNNPDIFTIDEGSDLKFEVSDQVAKVYEPEVLRCPDCIVKRG